MILIDEIDSLIGTTRQQNRGPFVTTVLSAMSRIIDLSMEDKKKYGRAIILGTTNGLDINGVNIEPAYARRFKHIYFSTPTIESRVQIFYYYLDWFSKRKKIEQMDKEFVFDLMALEDGITGSDIENIIKNRVILSKNSNITKFEILEEMLDILVTKYQIEYKLPSYKIIQIEKLFQTYITNTKSTNNIDLKLLKIELESILI